MGRRKGMIREAHLAPSTAGSIGEEGTGGSRARALLLLFLLVAVFTLARPGAARAELMNGACVLKMTVNFGGATLLSGSGTISFSVDPADTICAPAPNTGDLPWSLITTMGMAGSGASLVRTCEATQASGTYTATFGSTYPGTSGTFLFAGDAAGATLTFADLAAPVFIGQAVLSLDPLSLGNVASILGCTGSGMGSLVYAGVLVFNDP